MSQITIEAPEHIAQKFMGKKVVSYKVMYESIVEDYENSFEYESVNMEAGEFRDFLAKELNYD